MTFANMLRAVTATPGAHCCFVVDAVSAKPMGIVTLTDILIKVAEAAESALQQPPDANGRPPAAYGANAASAMAARWRR